MRLTIFAAIVIATLPCCLHAQGWEVVDFPLDDGITGIWFVHPDTGHIVTATGKHGRTFDGGKTWGGTQVTPGHSLEDVYFVNGVVGFVCGRRGSIYTTNDAGGHWKDLSWEDTAATFVGVRMLDPDTGLATGLQPGTYQFGGIAVRTTDGGQTWERFQLPGLAYGELFLAPGIRVYCLSKGYLNYSDDKGATWESIRIDVGKPVRAMTLSGNHGLMFGNYQMLAYTDDRARTWHKVDLSDYEFHIVCGVMLNDSVGYVGGTNSTILRTSDGGKTWERQLMARSFDVIDFFLIEDWLWAAGTDGGMMRKKVKR